MPKKSHRLIKDVVLSKDAILLHNNKQHTIINNEIKIKLPDDDIYKIFNIIHGYEPGLITCKSQIINQFRRCL